MSTSPADPARYNSFLMDLLGVMAYGELSAFERLSSDARYSPSLHDRAVLGRIAVIEFQHYELVSAKLDAMGLDPEAAMLPFQPSVDHFHERTRPADWYESLMKAYVIDTVSADFYRAISRYVDAGTRALVEQIQADEEATAVLRERLKTALADDPRLASRLALWARRLLGEALTQAQRVSFEHAFVGGLIGADEDAVQGTGPRADGGTGGQPLAPDDAARAGRLSRTARTEPARSVPGGVECGEQGPGGVGGIVGLGDGADHHDPAGAGLHHLLHISEVDAADREPRHRRPPTFPSSVVPAGAWARRIASAA